MAGLTLRREFCDLVQELIDDSESEDDSEQELMDMDTERYNNNDEDLTNYVREFKTKVVACEQIETTYIKSDANKAYRFPRIEVDDSESSIQSLEAVRFYKLESQNEKHPYSDSEKLAVVVQMAGKLMHHQLTHYLR